ncbi:MAG: hypothetical protein ACOYM2_17370 [Rectinemataceae bacterium]
MKKTMPRVKAAPSQAISVSFAIIILIAFIATGIAFLLQHRNATLIAAKDALSFDATETASTLASALGAANKRLEKAKDDFVGKWTSGQEKSQLVSLAFQIRWVQNAFLLDENGRLMDSAFPRMAPVLALKDGLLRQFRTGTETVCKILDAPTESGKALVLIKVLRRDFPMRYCAVVFSGFESEGRHAETLSSTERVMSLAGDTGSYDICGNPMALLENPSRFLKTSVTLSGWPVTLSLALDKKALFKDSASRVFHGRRLSMASSK